VIELPPPGALFAMLLFSLVGFAAFMYGRKAAQWRPIAIGVALMVYPYFVDATWLLWTIGVALVAALFVWRE